MKLTVRHLVWRDGHPRWVPGPSLRDGFKARDLRDDAGRWLTMQAAIDAANALNVEADAWRSTGRPRRRDTVPTTSAHSCRRCWQNFETSPWFSKLGDRTQADYRKRIRIFLDAEFGEAPVRAITRPQLIGYYQHLTTERGHAMANSILAVVSILMSHAERLGWRAEESNPAFRMARPSTEPRTVIWTPSEVVRLITVADRIGHAGIGDAILIGLHTAQREGDVLRLEEPTQVGAKVRFPLRQSKRQALVSVPATAALIDRVEAIRRRRRLALVPELHLTGPLVRRHDGRPYKDMDPTAFNADFRAVRLAASLGDAAHGEAPMPDIASKWYSDLRDTAITRLALADCSLAEIRAISGHSLATITTVLRHYLVMDAAMADGAINKLQAWMSKEGVRV